MVRNLGAVERAIRSTLGALAIAAGLLLLRGVAGIALGLVGAVLVLSGATGFCHVRRALGALLSNRR
jgi:hypothetical protein